MKPVRSFRGMVCASMVLLGSATVLEATALFPAHDLEGPGLSVAYAGAGLLGGRSKNLTVVIGGPVELALLYWAGRDRPCPQDEPGGPCVLPEDGPYKDQVLALDLAPVEGTLLGSESQPDTNAGPINNLGYVADVTDLVRSRGTGRQTFRISDADPASNLADLDGAGLLVVYTDPAVTAPARVIVYHGLDFAYGEDRTAGDTQVTDPFTFNHGAARASARRGKLVVFAADAVDIGPDRIDVSRNPSLSNRLDGSAGASWDADLFPVDVPAGAGATSVQVFSEPVGKNPDSVLWVMAALWLPLPVPSGCSAAFWDRSQSLWSATGTLPRQKVSELFSESKRYGPVAMVTARAALRFKHGGGLLGAAKALAQAGVAALLNAGHPRVEFPLTRTQVITRVDTTLRSEDAAKMLDVARELGAASAAECPLD
ncbi:MAG TPA: hypothetical protein VLQ45_01950 [Thermoanaerobaculia bacterium]|nr:hypothetical protein [Thermoanaerobaculia bacterium]